MVITEEVASLGLEPAISHPQDRAFPLSNSALDDTLRVPCLSCLYTPAPRTVPGT